MDNIFKVIEEQMKNNPEELKKLKRKMKKWQKQPEGKKKLENMLRTLGADIPQGSPQELEPRDILRARLKAMKDKRTGRS